MGFRSTLVAQDWNIDWPQWFRDKYPQLIYETRTLSLDYEAKTYLFRDLPADVQHALAELGWFDEYDAARFVYVWLHECGGLTRVLVDRDAIHITYPTEWALYDGNGQDSMHGGCYDCDGVPAAGG